MKQKLAAIISLIALTFIMALTSCAPISDNVGGNGTGGNGNSSQITIKLPPIASSAIRALTEEQVSRLQRDTKKYRVTFNGVGQTITREGEGTTYSATFPVGTQVGVTVYCLNAKGEIIVRTVTKNITISSGANSLSFKLSDDGTEIIHESGGDTPGGDVPGGDIGGGSGDDEKPDDTDKEPDDDDSGGDDNPPAPPPPVTEYVNITFNQGFVYTNTVHQSPSTWQAMTGASLPNSGQREKGSPVSQDQASATGYVFKGWVESNVQPSGDAPDTQSFNYVQNYDSDMTLYAIWEQIEPNSHEVKFETGAGSDSVSNMPANTQKQATTQVTFTETPTRAGYNFTGWSANVSGVNVTQQGSIWTFTMPDNDVTLTAQWQIITYTISYEPGIAGTSPQTETFTIDTGTANVTLKDANTFSRTGYTLSQWNAGNNNWSPSTDISKTSLIALATGSGTSRTITLTAQWQAKTLKVKYNANAPQGSTVTGSVAETDRTYGSSFTLAENGFSVQGYSFNGWFSAANGGQQVQGNSSTYMNDENDINVYAQWTAIDINVTLNAGSGTGTDTQTVKFKLTDTSDQLPQTTTFTKAGYKLAGWSYSDTGNTANTFDEIKTAIKTNTVTLIGTSKDTLTLYAVWEIDYKTNKADWAVGDIVCDNGNALTLANYNAVKTDTTLSPAVAVVYKNEANKVYIVGKVHEQKKWCLNNANGYNIEITTLQCDPDSGTRGGNYTWTEGQITDGSGNWQKLKNELGGNDDTGTTGNYPAWEWANGYGTTQGLSGDLATDWYLPTLAELFYIWKTNSDNSDAIENSLTAAAGNTFGSNTYWSSTTYIVSGLPTSSNNMARNLGFSSGSSSNNLKTAENNVCAVRQFTY